MAAFPNGIFNFGSMWRMATKVPNRVAFIRMKSHPDTILESNMIPFPVDICPGRPTNCRKPGWNCESPHWKSLKSVSNLWEHSLILTRISSECLLSPWVRFVSTTYSRVYGNAGCGVFKWGGTKLERFLPKNQHTQRKLLNFENWISGGLRSFQKSEF